mmetsp:Transcript_24566/g.52332  ORF Transcript_24566/g.52332 Transcript_24566/m.52332 type:complete len:269 (+) Transcript_24566:207-1013(+)
MPVHRRHADRRWGLSGNLGDRPEHAAIVGPGIVVVVGQQRKRAPPPRPQRLRGRGLEGPSPGGPAGRPRPRIQPRIVGPRRALGTLRQGLVGSDRGPAGRRHDHGIRRGNLVHRLRGLRDGNGEAPGVLSRVPVGRAPHEGAKRGYALRVHPERVGQRPPRDGLRQGLGRAFPAAAGGRKDSRLRRGHLVLRGGDLRGIGGRQLARLGLGRTPHHGQGGRQGPRFQRAPVGQRREDPEIRQAMGRTFRRGANRRQDPRLRRGDLVRGL